MATREELADDLAADVMAAMARLRDDSLWEKVSKVIGTSSLTTQEAFVTAMRTRLAAQRGRTYLEQLVARAANPDLPPPEIPTTVAPTPSPDSH